MIVLAGDLDRAEAAEVLGYELGVEQLDSSALRTICRELVEANPRIVADVKSGKEKAVGALIGQARQRNPNANPNDVRAMCLEIIRSL